MKFTFLKIKADPSLNHLWCSNPKTSDDVKPLDVAIGEKGVDFYTRPLMPMEIHAYTNPKYLIHGKASEINKIPKELSFCNAVEVHVLRDRHGKQLGRIREYVHDPEMSYENQ